MQQTRTASLIDDNLIVRSVLRTVLAKQGYQVFGSGNGVEGLGYIFVSNPDLIVVDTTLPRYDGLEVVNFLASHITINKTGKPIIVLTQGEPQFQLGPNYSVLSKRDWQFLPKFIAALGGKLDTQPSWPARILFWLANLADRIALATEGNMLRKAVFWPLWTPVQFAASLLFGFFYLLGKVATDANLAQANAESYRIKSRYYPTMVAGVTLLIFGLMQFALLGFGSFTLFNLRVSSVFATQQSVVNIGLNSAVFDPSLAELDEGVLKLKSSGERFDTNPVTIDFNTKVEFTELWTILEASSVNTLESSLDLVKQVSNSTPRISYQLSPNNMEWYYFSPEGIWEKTHAGEVSANSIQMINAKLVDYQTQVGGNQLYLRAYFVSDGEQNVELNSLTINRKEETISMANDVQSPGKPVDTKLEDIPVSSENFDVSKVRPVILQAVYHQGNKLITGRTSEPIPQPKLSDMRVEIYYSKDKKEGRPGEPIGTASLTTNIRGESVFFLQTPAESGGYVTAVLVDPSSSQQSTPAVPVENSTFTVDSTGDESDDTLNGVCSVGSPTGGLCTLRAALEEANDVLGADNIYFNIPDTDPGYRDYDDPETPSSGDGAGGDDYWTIRSSALFNSSEGVIDGESQETNFGSDSNVDGPDIEIHGMSASGCLDDADNLTVNKLALGYCNMSATLALNNSDSMTITNSYIGLDPRGINSTSESDHGISIDSSAGVVVQDNIIVGGGSGLGGNDIDITDETTGLSVLGNTIGLNRLGNAVTDSDNGVFIDESSPVSSNVSIGDGTEAGRNIIGGHASSGSGVYIVGESTNIFIHGNYIGTDPTGTSARPNIHGIQFQGTEAMSSLAEVMGNLISGNEESGIEVNTNYEDSYLQLYILDNLIGTTANGQSDLGNGRSGIYISESNVEPPIDNITISDNLIRFNGSDTIDEEGFGGVEEYYGGIQVEDNSQSVLIENNEIGDHGVYGISFSFTTISSTSGPNGDLGSYQGTIRNNKIGSGASTLYPGVTLGSNLHGVVFLAASGQVYGNEINGNDGYGIIAQADTEGGDVNYFKASRPIIGGSSSLTGSRCGSTQRNCINSNDWGGIVSLETVPENETNLWSHNTFGSGNGTGGTRNIEQSWYGLFEVFVGFLRPGYIDLLNFFDADNLPLPASAEVRTELNPVSKISTAGIQELSCSTEAECEQDCPPGGCQADPEGASFGDAGFSTFLAPSNANTGRDNNESWYIVNEYTINNSGVKTTRGDIDFDEDHLASLPFSFDGDATNEAGLYPWLGEPWASSGTADRDVATANFAWGQIMDIEFVDANPVEVDGEFEITVDALDNIPADEDEGVSFTQYDDGGGSASGGGQLGSADALPDGRTTLPEALFIAKTFTEATGPITIKFAGTAFNPDIQTSIFSSPESDNDVTIDGTGVTINGADLGPGESCLLVYNAFNFTIKGFNFINCGTNWLWLSGGGIKLEDLTTNSTYLGTSTAIDIVGGDENVYGVTANDAGDADSGYSNIMNHPDITQMEYLGAGQYRITGTIDNDNESEYPVEIRVCESTNHESSHGACQDELAIISTEDEEWQGIFTVSGDDGNNNLYFTATASSAAGYTSEFGSNFLAGSANPSYTKLVYDIELNSPPDEADLTTARPTLSWDDPAIGSLQAPDEDSYKVLIDAVVVATLDVDENDYTPTSDLTQGEHTWQIQAFRSNDEQMGESEVYSFSISEPTPPGDDDDDEPEPNTPTEEPPTTPTEPAPSPSGVNLVTPTEGQIVGAGEIKFDWTDFADGTKIGYQLFVRKNGEGVMDVSILQARSEYTDAGTLPSGEYTWFVIAFPDFDQPAISYASRVGKFTVQKDIAVQGPGSSSGGDGRSNSLSSPLDMIQRVLNTLGLTSATSDTRASAPAIASATISTTSLALLTVVSGNRLLEVLGIIAGTIIPKRKRYWGVVFDFGESKPVPLAIINLRLQGVIVHSTMSDLNGKYALLVSQPGDYQVEVKAPGYQTVVQVIRILQKESEVIVDLGMTKFGATAFSRFRKFVYYRKMDLLRYTFAILLSMTVLGFVQTSVNIVSELTVANTILLSFYLLLGALLARPALHSIGLKKGKVVEAATGATINSAVVRAYEGRSLAEVRVTDRYGQLKLDLPTGKYNIYASKPGFRFPVQSDRDSGQVEMLGLLATVTNSINQAGRLEKDIKMELDKTPAGSQPAARFGS